MGIAVRGAVSTGTLSACGRTFNDALNNRGYTFVHGL